MFFFEPWLVGFFGTALLSRLPYGPLRAVLPTIAYAGLFVPAFYSEASRVTAFWPFIVVFVAVASSVGSGMLEVLRAIGTSARRAKDGAWSGGWSDLKAGVLELVAACIAGAAAFAVCVAVDEPQRSHSQYCSYLARGLAVVTPLYFVLERRCATRPRMAAVVDDIVEATGARAGKQEEAPPSIPEVVVAPWFAPFHLRPRWRVAVGWMGNHAVVDAPFLSRDVAEARARELARTLDDRRSSYRLGAVKLRLDERPQ